MAKQRGRQDYSVNPLAANGVVNKTTTGADIPDATFDITHINRYEIGDQHVYIRDVGDPAVEYRTTYQCVDNTEDAAQWEILYTVSEEDGGSSPADPFIKASTRISTGVVYDVVDTYVPYSITLSEKNANYFFFEISNTIGTSGKIFAYNITLNIVDCPDNYYCILDFKDYYSKGSVKLNVVTNGGTITRYLPQRGTFLVNTKTMLQTVPPDLGVSITNLDTPIVTFDFTPEYLPLGKTMQITAGPINLLPSANIDLDDVCYFINNSGSSTTLTADVTIIGSSSGSTTDVVPTGESRTYIFKNGQWYASK